MSVGAELKFSGIGDDLDKKERRIAAAQLCFRVVESMYSEIGGYEA